jgi:hypothetical protein
LQQHFPLASPGDELMSPVCMQQELKQTWLQSKMIGKTMLVDVSLFKFIGLNFSEQDLVNGIDQIFSVIKNVK